MLALVQILGLAAMAATNLTGVEIYSNSTVRFGRWETRMKAAATPGSVSSFFTFNNNSNLDSPHPWREIDIEILGKNGKAFQSNIISGTASNKSTSERLHSQAFDLSQTYHTYTLDWTPDSIVWRLDGKLVRKTSAPEQQVTDLRDSAQTWRMNLWASNSPDWVGSLDVSKLPILQIVRWMRYSRYTPGSGPNGSDFTLDWVDSFTTISRTRWSLGNWTFSGNLATFSSSNAKVQDKHLLMMLSTDATAGQFPSSWPHDSSSTAVLPDERPVAASAPVRIAGSTWRLAGAESAQAYDIRGTRIGTARTVPGGVEIDLGRHSGLVVLRSGTAAWRLLAD